jgi:hypothetical protein
MQAFTGIHLGVIIASTWILLLNAIIGYQFFEDGTPRSIGVILGTAVVLFIGTGYIALDTGYRWTNHFDPSLRSPNRNIGLYVLYLLAPLVFIVIFFVLEAVLVVHKLHEKKPLGMRGSSHPFLTISYLPQTKKAPFWAKKLAFSH